jgi:tetratricopeptide (TPR) repeat protein
MRSSTLAAIGLATAAARVAADPNNDFKLADAYFAEGRALLDAGQVNEACEKFDLSLAKNPNAIGTLVNVAQCQARLGKMASAVATFATARDHAREAGAGAEPYIAVADENLARLTPLVPHLKIELADRERGLVVTIDDKPVALVAGQDSVELAIDPGPHDVVVTEPEHLAYREYVPMMQKDHKTLHVPALERVARYPLAPILSAGGGALVVGGVVIGLVAESQYNRALSGDCMNHVNTCTREGVKATDSARTVGNVGTAVGIAGVVATGIGGYLWWTKWRHSRHEHPAVTVAPIVGGDEGVVGVVAAGRF